MLDRTLEISMDSKILGSKAPNPNGKVPNLIESPDALDLQSIQNSVAYLIATMQPLSDKVRRELYYSLVLELGMSILSNNDLPFFLECFRFGALVLTDTRIDRAKEKNCKDEVSRRELDDLPNWDEKIKVQEEPLRIHGASWVDEIIASDLYQAGLEEINYLTSRVSTGVLEVFHREADKEGEKEYLRLPSGTSCEVRLEPRVIPQPKTQIVPQPEPRIAPQPEAQIVPVGAPQIFKKPQIFRGSSRDLLEGRVWYTHFLACELPKKDPNYARGLFDKIPEKQYRSLIESQGALLISLQTLTHNPKYPTKRWFTVFNRAEEFFEYQERFEARFGMDQASFFEIWIEGQKQKPRFDIDMDRAKHLTIKDLDIEIDTVVFQVCEAIQAVFQEKRLPLEIDLYDGGDSATKRSRHIVIPHYYHKNHMEALDFALTVKARVSPSVAPFVDEAVYSSKQNFRILGSCKAGTRRFKTRISSIPSEILEEPDRIQKLELLKRSLISYVPSGEWLPISVKIDERKVGNSGGGYQGSQMNLPEGTLERILRMLARLERCSVEDLPYSFDKTKGTMIIFQRRCPSACRLCSTPLKKDIHEHENPFVTVTKEGTVKFWCRRSGKGHHRRTGKERFLVIGSLKGVELPYVNIEKDPLDYDEEEEEEPEYVPQGPEREDLVENSLPPGFYLGDVILPDKEMSPSTSEESYTQQIATLPPLSYDSGGTTTGGYKQQQEDVPVINYRWGWDPVPTDRVVSLQISLIRLVGQAYFDKPVLQNGVLFFRRTRPGNCPCCRGEEHTEGWLYIKRLGKALTLSCCRGGIEIHIEKSKKRSPEEKRLDKEKHMRWLLKYHERQKIKPNDNLAIRTSDDIRDEWYQDHPGEECPWKRHQLAPFRDEDGREYVKGPMNCGKTHQEIQFILRRLRRNEALGIQERFIYVAANIEYAANITERLREGGIAGVVNYKVDAKCWDKFQPYHLVITLESLPLLRWYADVLIIDEGVKICTNLTGMTVASRWKEVTEAFENLFNCARCVKIMDADLDMRAYEFFEAMLMPHGNQSPFAHMQVCQYLAPPAQRMKIYQFEKHTEMRQKFKGFLEEGKNIAFALASSTEGKYLINLLKEWFPDGQGGSRIKYRLYSQNSRHPEDMPTICEEVRKYQVVMWTPVWDCGINVATPEGKEPHFHCKFIFGSSRSSCPRQLLQLAGRIRDTKENKAFLFCREANMGFPMTKDQIRRAIDNRGILYAGFYEETEFESEGRTEKEKADWQEWKDHHFQKRFMKMDWERTEIGTRMCRKLVEGEKYTELWLANQVEINIGRNWYVDTVEFLFREKGFEVLPLPPEEKPDEELLKLRRGERKTDKPRLKDDEVTAFNRARTIKVTEMKRLEQKKNRAQLTQTELLEYEKFWFLYRFSGNTHGRLSEQGGALWFRLEEMGWTGNGILERLQDLIRYPNYVDSRNQEVEKHPPNNRYQGDDRGVTKRYYFVRRKGGEDLLRILGLRDFFDTKIIPEVFFTDAKMKEIYRWYDIYQDAWNIKVRCLEGNGIPKVVELINKALKPIFGFEFVSRKDVGSQHIYFLKDPLVHILPEGMRSLLIMLRHPDDRGLLEKDEKEVENEVPLPTVMVMAPELYPKQIGAPNDILQTDDERKEESRKEVETANEKYREVLLGFLGEVSDQINLRSVSKRRTQVSLKPIPTLPVRD